MKWKSAVTASVLAATALACSESTAPPAPCDGPIDVLVGDTPVRFQWFPGCGVSAVTVVEVAGGGGNGRVIWGFTVPEDSPVGSGIRYGTAPEGANVWHAAESLEVARTYRVTVMMTVGGDAVVASGTATFANFPPD
jgi:hypothetical protein